MEPDSNLPVRPPTTRRAGNALLPTLVLLSTGVALLAALLRSSVETSENATDRAQRFATRRATASVNRVAAQALWSQYEASLTSGEPTHVDGLRTFLDGLGLTDQTGAATPVSVDLLDSIGLAANMHGDRALGDSTVAFVRAFREDDGKSTLLYVTSQTHGGIGEERHTESQTDVFSLEPPTWNGLDFALLATNIDCIMCHTTVDDVMRVHEGNGVAGPGAYRRARVGSIESFAFRHEPESNIAGTLYLGGPAIDEVGNVITDWSGLSLQGASLSSSGQIELDTYGNPIYGDLVATDASSGDAYQNLYTDYLSASDPVDGMMPDTFPLPFSDDGGIDPNTGMPSAAGEGNRIVDDEEFYAKTSGFGGSISGGKIGVSALGSTVSTAAEAAALAAGTNSAIASGTEGNVVLTGTASDPLRIDGDVAIDGDLIISGPITGTGTLWVKGNIYVRGDLEYADAVSGGERQYGIADDGSENLLAMTAGGNVVIGDPYRPQWGEGAAVTGNDDSSWNFVVEEMVSFNRSEWAKTQPRLPGKAKWVTVETPTTSTPDLQVHLQGPVTESQPTGNLISREIMTQVDNGSWVPELTWAWVSDGKPAPYTGGSWQSTPTGNTVWEPKMEWVGTGTFEDVPEMADVVVGYKERHTPWYDNANYQGTDYVPRYYAFGEGDDVPVQNRGIYYDPVTEVVASQWSLVEKWNDWRLAKIDPTDTSNPILSPPDTQAAVISTIEPTDSWMDPDVLKGLIEDALAGRDADTAFKVDATVYSANSVFGLVPNSADEGTNGEIRVQGQVLASDVGLLGPKGTEILYDPRGAAELDIRDETELGLRFVGTLPAPLQ